MDKGLQQYITNKEIGNDIHQKLRQLTTKKVQTNFTDRKRLTKARVITTQEVIRLREARESGDAKNAAKSIIRNGRKKLRELQVQQKTKSQEKDKKAVTIANDIIVHNIESEGTRGTEGTVGSLVVEEEWVSIDDFSKPPESSTHSLAAKESINLGKRLIRLHLGMIFYFYFY